MQFEVFSWVFTLFLVPVKVNAQMYSTICSMGANLCNFEMNLTQKKNWSNNIRNSTSFTHQIYTLFLRFIVHQSNGKRIVPHRTITFILDKNVWNCVGKLEKQLKWEVCALISWCRLNILIVRMLFVCLYLFECSLRD